MSDCRFGVSPVNYPDPDPDPGLPLVNRLSKSKWRILENPGPGFRLNERIIAGIRLPVRSRGNSL